MARAGCRRVGLAAGIAVLAMTTAACTGGTNPGEPAAAPQATSPVASPVSSRPVELRIDDVNPCELVTDETRQRFKIDRPTPAPREIVANESTCTFITSTAGQYLIALVRDKGVDALGLPVTTSVGGFPAIEIKQSDVKVGHLSIDIADGQHLDVEIQRLDSIQPVDEVHRDTQAFAEAVLATLRQKLGR